MSTFSVIPRPATARACRTCGEAVQHFRHGECHICSAYRYRTGRTRPAVTTRQCVNCPTRAKKGQWRQGLCSTCYQTLYRLDALGGVA